MTYVTWGAYKWQKERKIWKEDLIKERTVKLNMVPLEAKIDDIPGPNEPKAVFDEKWLYRPLSIKGIFDHTKETLVQRTRDGTGGYDVITPMYTSVDSKTGSLTGIFVNRGRIPLNYKESKIHHNTGKSEVVEVEGVLFYSEGLEKTDDKDGCYLKIDLESFVQKTSLENKEFATFAYLKAVELKLNDGSIE